MRVSDPYALFSIRSFFSAMDSDFFFEDLDPLHCSLFSKIRDLNLLVRDSNLFPFFLFCFSFTLKELNPFVEDSDPLTLSPNSSLLH